MEGDNRIGYSGVHAGQARGGDALHDTQQMKRAVTAVVTRVAVSPIIVGIRILEGRRIMAEQGLGVPVGGPCQIPEQYEENQQSRK